MASAHELAHRLLTGPDYEVVLQTGPGAEGRAGRVRAVKSMSG